MFKTLYFVLSVLTGSALCAGGIQPETSGETIVVERTSVALPTAKAFKPSEIIDPTDPRPPKLPKDVEVVKRLLSVTSTATALLLLYDFGVVFYNVIFPYKFSKESADWDTAHDAATKEYEVRTGAMTPTDSQEASRIRQILTEQQRKLQLEYRGKINQRRTVVERQGRCIYNQMIVVPTTVVLRHPASYALAVASHLCTLRDQWQQSWFRASLNSIHLSATLYRDLRLWWHKRHNRGASDVHKVAA